MDEQGGDGRPPLAPNQPSLWLRIGPEPTEDELAAVVAALTVLAGEAPRRHEGPPPPLGRWALAGRRAAHRGRDVGGGGGWRRGAGSRAP